MMLINVQSLLRLCEDRNHCYHVSCGHHIHNFVSKWSSAFLKGLEILWPVCHHSNSINVSTKEDTKEETVPMKMMKSFHVSHDKSICSSYKLHTSPRFGEKPPVLFTWLAHMETYALRQSAKPCKMSSCSWDGDVCGLLEWARTATTFHMYPVA